MQGNRIIMSQSIIIINELLCKGVLTISWEISPLWHWVAVKCQISLNPIENLKHSDVLKFVQDPAPSLHCDNVVFILDHSFSFDPDPSSSKGPPFPCWKHLFLSCACMHIQKWGEVCSFNTKQRERVRLQSNTPPYRWHHILSLSILTTNSLA